MARADLKESLGRGACVEVSLSLRQPSVRRRGFREVMHVTGCSGPR
jgi:hypothetical protein